MVHFLQLCHNIRMQLTLRRAMSCLRYFQEFLLPLFDFPKHFEMVSSIFNKLVSLMWPQRKDLQLNKSKSLDWKDEQQTQRHAFNNAGRQTFNCSVRQKALEEFQISTRVENW